MASTNIQISDEIHQKIIMKQGELAHHNRYKTKLSVIVEKAILNGLDKAVEELKDTKANVNIKDIKIKGIDYDVPEVKLEPLEISKIEYPQLIEKREHDICKDNP